MKGQRWNGTLREEVSASPGNHFIAVSCFLLTAIFLSCNIQAATIDLMIVYTPAARILLGDTETCRLKFEEEIRKTNKAFEDSGISHRLRLIHLEEIPYAEASAASFTYPDDVDMDRLKDPSDGFMDYVHTLRDTHQADCVVLINSKNGGKGALHKAWALVGIQRLNGYTFSHEVGHLFGAHHAIGDKWSPNSAGCQQGDGWYDNSHGYHFTANGTNYHTIMAYTDAGEQLHPCYSTPDLTLDGTPIGDVNTADNADTIEREGSVLAGWRTAYPDALPPTDITATDGNNYNITISWNTGVPGSIHRVYRQPDGSDDPPSPLGAWQAATTFIDNNAVPYVDYRYYVSSKKIGVSSPSPLNDFAVGSCVLGPPANVQATDGTSMLSVTITWDSETTGVYYRVYRSETDTGPTIISLWQTNTFFHDSPPLGNKIYYYWVKSALDSAGTGETEYSDPDSGYQSLRAPNAVASNGETSLVEVTWNAVANARYYKVWRRENQSSNTPDAVTSWITNLVYLDTDVIPGIKYDYMVSCSPYANDMEPSGRGPANIGWLQYPAPPGGCTAADSTSTNGIAVNWNPVEGASANYCVMWYPTNDSSDRVFEPWTTNTSLNVTNDTLFPGKEYAFKVRASLDKTFDHATDWSTENTGSLRLATPQHFEATDGTYTNRIVLRCDPVEGAGCYQFYRSSSVAGDRTAISSWLTAHSYTNFMSPGQTYYYWVRAAVKPDLHPGDYSNVNPGESGLPPPGNVVASDATEIDHVAVSWNLLSGLYYYRVFCSTEIDGPKSALTPWLLSLSSYTHTSAHEGQTYYYWVKSASDSSGSHQSAFSDYDIGFRNLPAPTPTATCGTYADRIEISWPKVAGATHYRAYKVKTYPDSLMPLSDGWQTDLHITDYNGALGTSYSYCVKAAANATGHGESALSAPVIGAKKGQAPVWGRISRGSYEDKVTLSWTCDTNILYFKLYRSESPDGLKWPLQNWTAGRSFEDTTAATGTIYYYQVVGAKSVVGSSPTIASEWKQGWISPSTPEKPTVSDGAYSSRIEIHWQPTCPGLFHRVVRKTPKTDLWVDISGWQTATNFNDTNAAPGQIYEYALQAADDETGLHTTAQSESAQGSLKIAPPPVVHASQGAFADYVKINWPAVTSAQAYRIYRAQHPDGATNAISGWIKSISYQDHTALPGHIYQYSISCSEKLSGLEESERSTPVEGWQRPVPPTNLEASDGTLPDKVTIQWDDVMPEGYYQVLRAESLEGTKNKLSDWIDAVTWDDTTAEPGKTYYYFIEACGPVQGSNTSAYANDTGWRGMSLPQAPTLPAPIHLTNNTGRLPSLSWNTCDRASSYRVAIWTDYDSYGMIGTDGEPDPVLFGLDTNLCELEIPLEPGVTYYWQVHSQNTAGETAGPIWQFSTLPFSLLHLNGYNNVTTIQWEQQPGSVWIDYSSSPLSSPTWMKLAGPITQTNSWTGPIPASSNAYFRLRTTP